MSSKVSYSVLVYLERQDVPLEPFFETLETPLELFQDPSCWISVEKMEEFLAALFAYLQFRDPPVILREIGQKNHELRAWGVLDSVLKMVESPRDIFLQPERFLSYFLTPHPELEIESQGDNFVQIRLKRKPTAPLIHAYLLGAVEGLPTYTGRPPARIETLDETRLTMTWFDDQQSLFNEQESKRRQFHPEIVNSVIQSLKEQQLSPANETDLRGSEKSVANEAFEKMVHLEVEKRLSDFISRLDSLDQNIYKIRHDFFKMYDYFTRAQQIITLITPTARKASVKEAMRRVDWDFVQKEFPRLVEGACDAILTIKDQIQLQHKEAPLVTKELGQEREMTNLNHLIDTVVESLPFGEKRLKVDRHLNLDREVSIDSKQMTGALESIFKKAIEKLDRQSEIRVTTRPLGSKVQIEISDNGFGFAPADLEKLFDDKSDQSLADSLKVIQAHHGQVSVSSRKGTGSTYLIELPLS